MVNKPDLIAKVSGNYIVIDGIDSAIILDGGKTVDPLGLGYNCSWKCPDAFN